MTKFTLNQKMDAVVRYQNGIESAIEIVEGQIQDIENI
jgi:hypothetical protein